MIDPRPSTPGSAISFSKKSDPEPWPRENEAFRSPRNNVIACNDNRFRMLKEQLLFYVTFDSLKLEETRGVSLHGRISATDTKHHKR